MKSFVVVTALMVCGFFCVSAMEMPNLASFDKSFSTKVHPFSSKKEMDYYLRETWSNQLTEEENKKKLVGDFVHKCVDFSLKIIEKTKDYCIGELDSSKKILFSNKLIKEVTSLPLDTIASPDGFPVDSADKYKDRFLEIFSKIAESSVGCKLLRIITTKVVVNNWSKLPFIPTDGEKIKKWD